MIINFYDHFVASMQIQDDPNSIEYYVAFTQRDFSPILYINVSV